MSWQFNPSGWLSGITIPALTDYQHIAADIATWGGAIDAARYGIAQLSYLTLTPADLPGTTYSVSAASWTTGVATLTLGAHNITVNQHVTVASVTPTGYNRTDAPVTAVTGTTISYAIGSNPGTYSSGGTVLVDLLSTPAPGMIAMDTFCNLRVWDGNNWVAGVRNFFESVNADANPIFGLGYLATSMPNSFAFVTGANNNVALSSTGSIRINYGGPTGAFNITGFAGGVDGRILTVVNFTGEVLTYRDANSGSLPANQILTGQGDLAQTPGGSGPVGTAVFQYEATDQRWVLLSHVP